MTYPVTVVIPTIDSRQDFLFKRCLPSVRAADPLQVSIVFGPGGANEKRNQGIVGQPMYVSRYVLFVDDDSEIGADILKEMVAALEANPDAAFAYSDFRIIQEIGKARCGRNVTPGKWNVDRLRRSNYIDTTSLIRRSHFPGFDPNIKRFQDWDLWLTMAAMDFRGVYVPKMLFDKFVIDEGISARVPEEEAVATIRRKHRL